MARAGKFLAELQTAVDTYQKSDPVKIRLRTEANPPDLHVTLDPVGLEPGAIVGDCIHNLRAALDLMSCELARINDKSDKDVYFPLGDDGDTYEKRIKDKNFHRTGSDCVDLLRTFQPYKGGNDDLRAIHDLDIEDKHRALILTPHTVSIEFKGTYNLENLEDHNFKGAVAKIDFRFPPGSSLAGRDVLQTLKDLMELVNGIIEAFERLSALRNTT